MKNNAKLINVWLTASTVGLFLLLLTLKTFDVIAWSWWWIYAPIYVPAAVSLVIVILVLIYIKKSK